MQKASRPRPPCRAAGPSWITCIQRGAQDQFIGASASREVAQTVSAAQRRHRTCPLPWTEQIVEADVPAATF